MTALARHHAPVHPPIHPPALSSTVGTPVKPKEAQISLVNMAARQRMLSQRMILQTVLAAQGQAGQLMAARKSLDLFTSSQQHLRETGRSLPAEQSQIILRAYEGVDGVGQIIDTFIEQLRTTLNQIERQDRRMGDTLASLVDSTDRVLDALNRATTAFDQVTAAQSQAMMRELTGIVASIQTVAREAKVVSFNAQVMAARAGQHGREFAVVANVLSGITAEIDGLSLKAVSLAGRQGA